MTAPRQPERRRRRTPVRSAGDRVFAGTARGAGILILVVLAGVAVFLIVEGDPGAHAPTPDDLAGGARRFVAYVGPLVFGTLLAAVHRAARRARRSPSASRCSSRTTRRAGSPQALGYVDRPARRRPLRRLRPLGHRAASRPQLVPLYVWLDDHLGFIPLFAGPGLGDRPHDAHRRHRARGHDPADHHRDLAARSSCRRRALHEEAALALGATRWEMIRMAVFPYARSGIVSGAMLGLGRALGETMAVAMVLSATRRRSRFNLIGTANPPTIAANIALQLPGGHGLERQRC